MYKHLNEKLLLEMAEIGRFDNYKIMIYGAEGPVPHFHIDNDEKNTHCCIKILEDDYFQHGIYKDKLCKSEVKRLKTFLIKPHKFFGRNGYNNWQIICIYWNDNNPRWAIKEDFDKLIMPAYNNL
mgnify:CR=1 FL=1